MCPSCSGRMKGPDDDGAWQERRRRVFLLRRGNFKSVYLCRSSYVRDKQEPSTVDAMSHTAAATDEFDVDPKVVSCDSAKSTSQVITLLEYMTGWLHEIIYNRINCSSFACILVSLAITLSDLEHSI